MPYWKYMDVLVNMIGGTVSTYPNLYAFPFKYQGVAHDGINTYDTIYYKADSSSRYGLFAPLNLDHIGFHSGTLYNPCIMIKTEQNISMPGFTNINNKTIAGRWRLNTLNLTTVRHLKYTTIPVYYTLAGKEYRYITFPHGVGYGNTLYVSNTIVPINDSTAAFGGFYSIPEYISGVGVDTPADFEMFTTTTSSAILRAELLNEIIDFGATPQNIPEPLYDFIVANATEVYPYTYTIKNKQGETLRELTEMPGITSVILSNSGGNVSCTLRGVNGVNYNADFSTTIPQGYQFLGLGYSPTERYASIATGGTTAVTWDANMILYAIIGKYNPPTTRFAINVYKNESDPRTVDKTITSVGTLEGVLREGSSIIDPVISIAQTDVPVFNYVFIPIFSRYYYVRNIESIACGIWKITMHVDVLMSYRDAIRSLECVIARQENDYNNMLIDTMLPLENAADVEYIDAGPTIFDTTAPDVSVNYVVVTMGGDT